MVTASDIDHERGVVEGNQHMIRYTDCKCTVGIEQMNIGTAAAIGTEEEESISIIR